MSSIYRINIGKRPLVRSTHRCEQNIRIDLNEIGVNTKNWLDTVEVLLESHCECIIEPSGSISLGIR
jgi:hypothetical protein